MRVELPTGFLDGQDLFDYAIVDELRGKQQNYLINRDLVIGNIGHIPKILEDLVISIETKEGMKWQGKIQDAIQKLPSSDIEALLIKIRENTFGPRYYFEAVCPHCGHKHKNQRLDLDKLEVKKYSTQDMLDDAKRTTTLPKCNKSVVLKPMYLKDMFAAAKIASDKHDALITNAVALSLASLDGNPVTDKEVENLSAADIHHIEKFLEQTKLEGDIDTNIQIDCENCSSEFEIKLNVFEPDFFSPTRASKNSTT
jgi:hypothetical protein